MWLSCETTVLVLASHFSRTGDGIAFPWRKLGTGLLAYLPAAILCALLYYLIPDPWIRFGAVTAVMGIYTAVYVLFVKKDETVLSLLRRRW